MNKYTKLIFVTFLSAPLFAIAQTTLFQQNFSGGDSTVDLRSTAVASWHGGGTAPNWDNESSSSSFRADGSVVNDPAGTHSGIWLPVTIEKGKIYTLSADVDLTSGSDWISLGYAEHKLNNVFWSAGGYGTAAVMKDHVEPYTDPAGSLPWFDGAFTGVQKLKIVLDATDSTSSNWTMQFFENGVDPYTQTFKATIGNYADIDYIGFTKSGDATGKIYNVKFEVQSSVPESSQSGIFVMIIVSLVLCSRRCCLGASIDG